MTNGPFSDEELTAFLDGELDDARAEAIALALETDVDLQAQLAALEVDFAPIRAAFDDMLGDAPDIALPVVTPARSVSRPLLAASIVALGVGFAAGWFAVPAPEVEKPGWLAVVASYQKLYAAETLEGVAPEAATISREVAAVSEGLGRNFDAGKLELAGLSYRRGQMLNFNGKPLAQFMYQTADGTPIALCAIKSGAGDKAVGGKVIDGLQAAIWRKDGFAYLVIGDASEAEILGFAKGFADQI